MSKHKKSRNGIVRAFEAWLNEAAAHVASLPRFYVTIIALALALLSVACTPQLIAETIYTPTAPASPAAETKPAGEIENVIESVQESPEQPVETPVAEPKSEAPEVEIVPEQPDQPIAVGQSRSGEITDANLIDLWGFEADEGDHLYISVEATSGDFDAVLDVLDENGRSILPAELDTFYDEHWSLSVPFSGAFHLEIGRFDQTLGGYEVSIRSVAEKTISVGDAMRGSLGIQNPVDVWTVEGVPGEVVVLEAEGEDGLDLELILFGELEGERLFLVDASFGVETTEVRVPPSGHFQVGVAEYGERLGDYALRVDGQPFVETVRPAPGAEEVATPLTPGDTIQDRITPDDRIVDHGIEIFADIYALQLYAGERLILDIDADNDGSLLDSTLRIYDAAWDQLQYNDDHDGYDSYLEFVAPASGRYFVEVRDYNAESLPDTSEMFYSLETILEVDVSTGRQLEPGAYAPTSRDLLSDGNPEPFPIPLSVARGEIEAEDSDLGGSCIGWTTPEPTFEFNWNGDVRQLRLSFTPFADSDMTLIVRDPSGGWHCDDDDGPGLNPSLVVRNPQDGGYKVWVGNWEREATDGELVVQEPASGSVTVGEPPDTIQSCGLSEAISGDGFEGAQVILGQHRSFYGDDNWADSMAAYVGQQTTVTEVAQLDDSGCPVVRVEADEGEWAWRIRDLTFPD